MAHIKLFVPFVITLVKSTSWILYLWNSSGQRDHTWIY